MQGSPAANHIVAYAFNDMEDHTPEGTKLFLYNDNVVFLADSEGMAAMGEHALRSFFSDHPYGSFVLEEKISSFSVGFEALGYAQRRSKLTRSASIDLGGRAGNALLAGIERKLREAEEVDEADFAATLQHIADKLGGYAAIDSCGALCDHRHAEVRSALGAGADNGEDAQAA